jgi:NAD(P)H-hydrate repair Nnr-like enzyme with NAD(P)H-hydrate dehydratase domain
VLAGCIASRLANGAMPFEAACEGVWLHGEASRITPPPFSAGDLADFVANAYRACL